VPLIHSFKGKPQLWKTRLIKDELIHSPNVHSRAVGTFNVPVSIMFVYKLSRELEGISEYFEHTKFNVPILLISFKNGIQARVLNLCVKGSHKRNRK